MQSPLTLLQSLLRSLTFALRQLKKSPIFAVVVVGSLALGIGASVTVFSVVRAVLLDPYPYKDADRMVHVEMHQDKLGRDNLIFVTATEYHELLQLPAVDDIFLMDNKDEVLTGDSRPISVAVGLYTANLFTYMGVPPLLGRQFTPADAPNGNASPVAVLSYLFWKKQYDGQPDIVGRSIELDHTLYTVVGVASPRFTWGDSEVYLPGNFTADPHYYVNAFLKIKPSVTYPALAAQIQPLLDDFARRDPTNFPQNVRVQIKSLNEEVLHGFEAPLLILFASVLLLLLIGCANVSILMLARGATRQQEFAVRASLGASRGRLIAQLLTEALLLSGLGALLGVALAYRGVALLAAWLPQDSFPHEAAIHVNATVLLFAVVTALFSGILFGLSPAWQLSRPELAALMQSASGKLTGSLRSRHTHRLLIAGQVMLTMLLLAGAGAAFRAFLTLYHTPLGFTPDHLFYTSVSLPKGGLRTWQYLANTQESFRQAAESASGVTSASISTTWTPPFSGYRAKIFLSSDPNLTDASATLALVSHNIFTTLEIPLLAGRFFTAAEETRAAHVALVNQAFLKQYLPNRDPIGQLVRSPGLRFDNPRLVFSEKPDDWLQIIGVVGDTRNDGLDKPVRPAVYLPTTMVVAPNAFLLIRARGNINSAMRAVSDRLHKADPDAFVQQQHDIPWLLENQGWARERFLASLFALFAVLALVLSATGIFSVVSYTVSQRSREFGVRMALGSQRSRVVQLVLRSSLSTVAFGLLAGLTLALALGRLLSTSAHATLYDPAMLLAVSSVLLLATVLACVYPAWRAATINPSDAIRAE